MLEDGDGGRERVRARYVIGADGASSTVRGLLGIDFAGSTYELAFALIDARVEGTLPEGRLLYYQAPTGTLMIAPLPDRVFRILAVLPQQGQEVTVPMMQELLDTRGPGGVRITEPVWQTVYRVHARQATEYRRGPVFLIGDAAHVHSPAGGQGMNNGIQDAWNLCWKLAAVLHGEAPESLLRDYNAERVEATNRIVATTDRQTRAWMADTRLRIAVRDVLFRLAARSGAVVRYEIPVMAGRRAGYTPTRETQLPSGAAFCRLGRRLRVGRVFPRDAAVRAGIAGFRGQPATWVIAAVAPRNDDGWLRRLYALADAYPRVRVVKLPRGEARRATGCAAPGFYLIRPDGHVLAHGHQRDLSRLGSELRRSLLPRA